jgi:hypothetical protein
MVFERFHALGNTATLKVSAVGVQADRDDADARARWTTLQRRSRRGVDVSDISLPDRAPELAIVATANGHSTVGLLGGILTYAVEAGIIAINPAHGLRKPKDNVRTYRLTEADYRTLDDMLGMAEGTRRARMRWRSYVRSR